MGFEIVRLQEEGLVGRDQRDQVLIGKFDARLLERAVIILVALQFEIEPVAIDLFQRQQALFGDRPMAVGE